ncbi:sigma-70 family RNA polymerase sigma factor [Corallococcus macrosporus]|uniref:Transcriptional regulator n=1 Tax=Corallococcus macrosporus DSM 14697 TaxID=1189310 RepID=A0A250JZ87_9BACT|nr:sigma-70 family RNA polymerase sigma factor [Corallococcus macrosporus]ATB49169.1 transcriptional regulator [Corallococcus macrosporus DSM 14697]
MTSVLASAFLAAREGASPPEPLPGLEARLARALATARAAWPGVELDGARFVAHLARHLASDAPVEALERLELGGLYLACACAERVPAALAAFEAHLLPEVYVAVSRMKLDPLALDELRQRVRERMLVSTEDIPARLAAYPGTGPLAGWVRAAALWLARDLVRQRAGRVRSDDSGLALLVEPGDDPELAYLKTTYRAEFNAAFAQALDTLGARERNLLRLKYLDGLSIDQLGALYGVHRSSAARYVRAAQDALVEATRRRLSEQLRLTGSQLDSILRLISSQLDVSLGRLLRAHVD